MSAPHFMAQLMRRTTATSSTFTSALLHTFSVTNCKGITVDSSGIVYLCNLSNIVYRYDLVNNVALSNLTITGAASGFGAHQAREYNGELYVVDGNNINTNAYVVNKSTGAIIRSFGRSAISNSAGVCVYNNQIYVASSSFAPASTGTGYVDVFTPDGTFQRRIEGLAHNNALLHGISIHNGILYATLRSSGYTWRYDLAGQVQLAGVYLPDAVFGFHDWDRYGNMLMGTRQATTSLYMFNASLNVRTYQALDNIQGVTRYGDFIYAVSVDGKLYKITSVPS